MNDKSSGLLKLSAEAKVGLFVLAGIIILVFMSLKIGGIRLGREEGYTLYVSFGSAAGLDKDASVRVAGVEIGKVKKISLRGNRAYLTLNINPDTKLGKDFTAVLTTKGLLGEKYLELIPGSPNAPPLKDGDEITRTITYADMDKLMTILSEVAVDVKQVTETLSHVLGGKEGETSLRNILKNIEDISLRVDRLVANNDEKMNRIVSNVDDFTALLKNDGPQISAELREAIKNLNEAFVKTSNNLNSMIDENRGNLKEGVSSLKTAAVKLQEAMDNLNKVTKEVGPQIGETVGSIGSIAKKIDKGEGTLGKLVNDPAIHENLNKTIKGINNYIEKTENIHTYVGYRGEYLFDAKNTKSYISLKVQPRIDKYYLFEIVDDPRGKERRETRVSQVNNTTTTTTDTVTVDQIKFSLQLAKRFDDLVIRGGLLESTGGAGLDYYFFKNRLKLSLEAFDFSKHGNPHIKTGAMFFINKYFHLTAGGDDIISRRGFASFYLGGGFMFDDDDLKYLMGSAPTSALKN